MTEIYIETSSSILEVRENYFEVDIFVEPSKIVEVVSIDKNPKIVEINIPGLPGPTGPPGDSSIVVSKICGDYIGGYRVVCIDEFEKLQYANCLDLTTAFRVLGVTLQAGDPGSNVQVLREGLITGTGWRWIKDKPVFLGANGLLVQNRPPTGFCLIIGTALSSTIINVNIQQPIFIQ